MNDIKLSRRKFLQTSAAGLAALYMNPFNFSTAFAADRPIRLGTTDHVNSFDLGNGPFSEKTWSRETWSKDLPVMI